jgi:hypothetical protein
MVECALLQMEWIESPGTLFISNLSDGLRNGKPNPAQ